MIDRGEQSLDLASLTVPRVGALVETGDLWEPWRLLDPAGEMVGPVAVWLRDLPPTFVSIRFNATTQVANVSDARRTIIPTPENRKVGGSIPPLATVFDLHKRQFS
jgi:hypothetical protein